MKLLLDTHSFIWFMNGETSLSQKAKELIEDASNEKYISVASIWEMAIKINLGRLSVKGGIKKALTDISSNNFTELNISSELLLIVEQLPHHHRDPFDRLLISQAIFEKMAIVSKDPEFKKYNISVIW